MVMAGSFVVGADEFGVVDVEGDRRQVEVDVVVGGCAETPDGECDQQPSKLL
jgi:hypothetical protein